MGRSSVAQRRCAGRLSGHLRAPYRTSAAAWSAISTARRASSATNGDARTSAEAHLALGRVHGTLERRGVVGLGHLIGDVLNMNQPLGMVQNEN